MLEEVYMVYVEEIKANRCVRMPISKEATKAECQSLLRLISKLEEGKGAYCSGNSVRIVAAGKLVKKWVIAKVDP